MSWSELKPVENYARAGSLVGFSISRRGKLGQPIARLSLHRDIFEKLGVEQDTNWKILQGFGDEEGMLRVVPDEDGQFRGTNLKRAIIIKIGLLKGMTVEPFDREGCKHEIRVQPVSGIPEIIVTLPSWWKSPASTERTAHD